MVSEEKDYGSVDYSPNIMTAITSNGSWVLEDSDFNPLDEIFSSDGDLSLVFLSADRLLYSSEINDDWYAAHRPFRTTNIPGSSGHKMTYLADETSSVLGCKSQIQICDLSLPSATRCGQLTGTLDSTPPQSSNGKQASDLADWISDSGFSLRSVIHHLKSTALTSRDRLLSAVQGPLPDNQWQLEVEYWHNIVKSSYQSGLIENAAGPSDSGVLKHFWQLATPEQQKQFCKSQKIRSTAYTNFSVLQLSIVLILGGIIIILGLVLEDLVFWIDKRRKSVKHSRLEWSTNDALQTQRLAHEELEIGPWKGCAGARTVPVLMEKGRLLAFLDISDPEHPRLKAPKQDVKGYNGTLQSVHSDDAVSQEDTIHAENNDSAGNPESVSSTEPQGINDNSEAHENTGATKIQSSISNAETDEGGLNSVINAGDYALISRIISLEQDTEHMNTEKNNTDAESARGSSADSHHKNIGNATEGPNSPAWSY